MKRRSIMAAGVLVAALTLAFTDVAAATTPDWLTTLLGRVLTKERTPDEAWASLAPYVDLRLPADQAPGSKAPLVVLAPGCYGWLAKSEHWRSVLLGAGFAVLHVDSFAARGLREPREIGAVVCDGKGVFGFERAGDIALALDRHPFPPGVDTSRVGLAGWSHGGWAVWSLVNFAAQDRTPPGLSAWPRPDPARFRAVVAVYPYCGFGSHSWSPKGAVAPPSLLVFAGRDENVDSEPCRQRAAAARAGGSKVEILEFPNATHRFDQPGDFDLLPHVFDGDATRVLEERMLNHLRRTLGPTGADSNPR